MTTEKMLKEMMGFVEFLKRSIKREVETLSRSGASEFGDVAILKDLYTDLIIALGNVFKDKQLSEKALADAQAIIERHECLTVEEMIVTISMIRVRALLEHVFAEIFSLAGESS